MYINKEGEKKKESRITVVRNMETAKLRKLLFISLCCRRLSSYFVLHHQALRR